MDYFNLLPDDLINKIRMINICGDLLRQITVPFWGDTHIPIGFLTERTIINISKRLLLLILFSLKTIAELHFAYV